MQDFDLKFYLSLFWRRFPLFLFVWALISVLGVAVAILLPEKYKSVASILVESEQIQGSTVIVGPSEQIQVVEQQMMTRSNLLELADRFGVFENRPDYSPSKLVEAMEDATEFRQLQLGRQQRGVQNAIAFTVSFSANSGPLAARVANEFVTQILDLNQTRRIDTAEANLEFYEGEDVRLNQELSDLEIQISNFKTENQMSLPQLLEFNQDQLISLKANLGRLEEEERELNDQRNQLIRAIENPELIQGEDTQISPEERELSRLESERATLRLTFSENNPKVRNIDLQIKSLKARIAQQNGGNGILEQRVSRMELALEQLDRRFLILREQRDEVLEEISRLETAVTKTPEVERTLNGLERKYSSLRAQYSENEIQLAAAKKGRIIEDTGKGERFRIIEQPSVPDEAEGPGKLVIAAGGVAGGFAIAFGLVVLLELLNRSIRRPAELVSGLGLQPFATVPYIITAREIRRRRLSIIAMLAMVSIAIPAVLYVVHYYYLPIDFLLNRVAEELGLDALRALFS